MNTFSIEELDREEIEFLPPRVVMTACQPKPCWQPCAPKPVCPPPPCVEVCADIKVDCLIRVNAGLRLF
jgi:hypothetical protein